MKVKILYFAQLREERGLAEETLETESDLRARDLLDRIATRSPTVKTMRNALSIAVNGTIVSRDFVLSDGDELALLPPMSGG